MKARTGKWVLGLIVLGAMNAGGSRGVVHEGRRGVLDLELKPIPTLKSRPADSSIANESRCADRLVSRLARRDGLAPFIEHQEVQVEPTFRIKVYFRFKRDMTGVLRRLGTFWKFPKWLGRGRYASSYGHGRPGFELHLDESDPSATVGFNALKSSDIDEHEPAGDLTSMVMHVVNVVQHKAWGREKSPCQLLAQDEKVAPEEGE